MGQSDDASVDETQQEQTQMTLSDAIGIAGISFSYQRYDISSSYETTDVAIPDAGEGYSYLILHVQVANTTDQAVTVDLITTSRSLIRSRSMTGQRSMVSRHFLWQIFLPITTNLWKRRRRRIRYFFFRSVRLS